MFLLTQYEQAGSASSHSTNISGYHPGDRSIVYLDVTLAAHTTSSAWLSGIHHGSVMTSSIRSLFGVLVLFGIRPRSRGFTMTQ